MTVSCKTNILNPIICKKFSIIFLKIFLSYCLFSIATKGTKRITCGWKSPTRGSTRLAGCIPNSCSRGMPYVLPGSRLRINTTHERVATD